MDSPMTEMPIGRISESYFVLSWVGLLYAPFIALLFWALYYFLFHRTSSPFYRAVFLMLLMAYCIPDAHMFYLVATLTMWCIPLLLVLKMLGNMLSPPEDQSEPAPVAGGALQYDALGGTPQYR
jgi:hypothetical protein